MGGTAFSGHADEHRLRALAALGRGQPRLAPRGVPTARHKSAVKGRRSAVWSGVFVQRVGGWRAAWLCMRRDRHTRTKRLPAKHFQSIHCGWRAAWLCMRRDSRCDHSHVADPATADEVATATRGEPRLAASERGQGTQSVLVGVTRKRRAAHDLRRSRAPLKNPTSARVLRGTKSRVQVLGSLIMLFIALVFW